MGLDSVELIMEFEKHFRISIPDLQAEKINTISDATEVISKLVTFHTPGRDVFSEVFAHLTKTLQEMELTTLPLTATTPLDKIIPITQREEHWQRLAQKLNLQLPPLHPADLQRVEPAETIRLLGIRIGIRRPLPPLLEVSLEKCTDYICGLNYLTLIDFTRLSSRYEVFIGVMGITHDKLGIEISMIHPHSSFTNDLGID